MTRVQGQGNIRGEFRNERIPLEFALVAACNSRELERSTATRPAGVHWLQRHVPTQVREVNFHEGSSTPIDATFVPLRPGLALKTGNECRPEKMLETFASWA